MRNNRSVRIRFLLGPAGSGKTYRCLAEIRDVLNAAVDGPALVLLAPKQSTYLLERQLLSDPSLAGYTRLQILSFERLAYFVFERLGQPVPDLLDEEGRLMVLRALLARHREDLKLFRASARLNGFAQQLSLTLGELQNQQLSPAMLEVLAGQVGDAEGLPDKLHDLGLLLHEYLAWLEAHHLRDADCLLASATEALSRSVHSPGNAVQSPRSKVPSWDDQMWLDGFDVSSARRETVGQPVSSQESNIEHPASSIRHPASRLQVGQLWVDGFGEFSAQELGLLSALFPGCDEATLAFCIDPAATQKASWLSHWSMLGKTVESCRKRFAALPGVELSLELLARDSQKNRFVSSPELKHLEQSWGRAEPFEKEQHAGEGRGGQSSAVHPQLSETLRLVACANPEEEAVLAAREILQFVQKGGRYREVTVMLRALEPYYQPLRRIFMRYDIPFFLDRREPVAHHPLAELTRSALRTVALGWQPQDWFAALKSGLVPAQDEEIDRLENEALARGWKGTIWHQPIYLKDPTDSAEEDRRLRELEAELERIRQGVVAPFQKLALALGGARNRSTGPELAQAVREFWDSLKVEQQLERWSQSDLQGLEPHPSGSVHETVWRQMNGWLKNVELAFPSEPLAIRDWLPILEAGLAHLSVGVIPPALDQVLVGAIDRSRNPDVKLGLVLGMNETIFPAQVQNSALLTETDRRELEKQEIALGSTARGHLARERFFAYIACTRARQRLVLTCARTDGNGARLNPSPFLGEIQRLFPELEVETAEAPGWRHSLHTCELMGELLSVARRVRAAGETQPRPGGTKLLLRPDEGGAPADAPWRQLMGLPQMASLRQALQHYASVGPDRSLAPELAGQLYGPALRTSVSRMEQFAACPFKFFVHSGLRAEERQLFELDVREQGSFQHDVLAFFHEELRRDGKRWRDVTPAEARERVERIARGLIATYRQGLLQSSEQTRFLGRVMTESLLDFVEVLVTWMREQYRFDPVAVELPFGREEPSPAWILSLEPDRRLELQGRIDRVDLCRRKASGEAFCVVIDYKSGQKELEAILLANGLQLQLLGYLNVLRRCQPLPEVFGVGRIVPAGVFYVSLRGKYGCERNRTDALAETEQARRLAYQHTGRFDAGVLRLLDARPDAQSGDQFNYRLKRDGTLSKSCQEPVSSAAFEALLDSVEAQLKAMGRQIYAGVLAPAPFRKGNLTACAQCDYGPICRIDPASHRFRVLRNGAKTAEPEPRP